MPTYPIPAKSSIACKTSDQLTLNEARFIQARTGINVYECDPGERTFALLWHAAQSRPEYQGLKFSEVANYWTPEVIDTVIDAEIVDDDLDDVIGSMSSLTEVDDEALPTTGPSAPASV